ncbi:MAG: hypothetical protein GY754_02945 [bacterium]|nr:hypothetical protein [bacterium]
MKKVILTIVIFFAVGICLLNDAYAAKNPVAAGNLVFDGSTSLGLFNLQNKTYTYSGTEVEEQTMNFGLETNVGYFIIKGLSLGGVISFKLELEDKTGGGTQTKDSRTITLQAGPGAAYYYPLGDFILYAGAAYTLGMEDYYDSVSSTETSGFVHGFIVSLGGTYMLTDSVGLFVESSFEMLFKSLTISDTATSIIQYTVDASIGVRAFVDFSG